MARLATLTEDFSFVLRFAVVTTETVRHGTGAEFRAFGMIGIMRLAVFRHMPTRNDNWISLDRLLMHDAGMAGGAAFLLSALEKRIHVFAVTHDQPDILHRWWQITRRHNTIAEWDGSMGPDKWRNAGVRWRESGSVRSMRLLP